VERTWAEKDGRSPTNDFLFDPTTHYETHSAASVDLRRKRGIRAAPFEMITDAVEIEINDRRGVKSKHLAEEQTASDSNTKRPP
jgi:hypothetical protein